MTRLLMIITVMLLSACKSDPVVLRLQGETMGTTYTVIAIDHDAKVAADDVQNALQSTFDDVNALMSNWDPSSEISRFNAHAGTDPFEISQEMVQLLLIADEVHDQSLGRFDLTLGPVIEAWGFGNDSSPSKTPDQAKLAEARKLVGQADMITLTTLENTLSKADPSVSVYLSAIAKGYGIDRAAETLKRFGFEDYMVEIGGDIFMAGLNPNGVPWRIGVERPAPSSQRVETIVEASGLGMATSGDYRNYFEQDGVRYTHILDATTGRPVTHTTASATVLAENATIADAWATAMLALGAERGREVAEKLDLAVFFILRDPTIKDIGFTTIASSRFQQVQARD